MNKVALGIVGPLLSLALACGGKDKPPEAPTPPETKAQPSTTSAEPAKADKMAVNVDDSIIKACNLKFSNVEEAPKFDFDSEQLTEGEKQILDAIAKCLTTGPLKGRAVDLVGRTDPRGETQYNMTLGAKRAHQVQGFLANLGVPGDKLHETSRGELDSSGKDEDGWRKDRRVDVKLRQ